MGYSRAYLTKFAEMEDVSRNCYTVRDLKAWGGGFKLAGLISFTIECGSKV